MVSGKCQILSRRCQKGIRWCKEGVRKVSNIVRKVSNGVSKLSGRYPIVSDFVRKVSDVVRRSWLIAKKYIFFLHFDILIDISEKLNTNTLLKPPNWGTQGRTVKFCLHMVKKLVPHFSKCGNICSA